MKHVLHYDAFQQMQNFYSSSANELFSIWEETMKMIWECSMNFDNMVSKLDPTTKAYRPTWGKGELLWKKGNILVHNTPYWSGEGINQFIGGYPYVCEKCDIEASDWVLVKDEIEKKK